MRFVPESVYVNIIRAISGSVVRYFHFPAHKFSQYSLPADCDRILLLQTASAGLGLHTHARMHAYIIRISIHTWIFVCNILTTMIIIRCFHPQMTFLLCLLWHKNSPRSLQSVTVLLTAIRFPFPRFFT